MITFIFNVQQELEEEIRPEKCINCTVHSILYMHIIYMRDEMGTQLKVH